MNIIQMQQRSVYGMLVYTPYHQHNYSEDYLQKKVE